MSQSVLYYPTIDIEDGRWLRNAVLYWDEICSIVPFENYTDFSPEIGYLQQRNLYRAIYPQDIFWGNRSVEFVAKLQKRLQRRPPGQNHMDMLGRSVSMHCNKIHAPVLSELINFRKIPKELSVQLVTQGYIHHIDDDGWMEVDGMFAKVYMRTLAEFAAKYDKQDMVISTDRYQKLNEVYYPTGKRESRAAFSLCLDNCLPTPSMDVGFEELLDFKEKRQAELAALRNKIREFEQRISQCNSIDELKAITESFRESWQVELRQSEKMFRSDNVGFVLNSLRSFIVDAGGAAGCIQGLQALGLIQAPKMIFGAVMGVTGMLGVGLCYRDYKNKIRPNLQDGGFAYIIEAHRSGIIRDRDIYEYI